MPITLTIEALSLNCTDLIIMHSVLQSMILNTRALNDYQRTYMLDTNHCHNAATLAGLSLVYSKKHIFVNTNIFYDLRHLQLLINCSDKLKLKKIEILCSNI